MDHFSRHFRTRQSTPPYHQNETKYGQTKMPVSVQNVSITMCLTPINGSDLFACFDATFGVLCVATVKVATSVALQVLPKSAQRKR